MAARLKIFWLITLCFFVASCASYRPAAMPGACKSDDEADEFAAYTIKPDDRVRVTLVDGGSIVGVFIHCDSTVLTIDVTDSNLGLADPGFEEIGPTNVTRRVVPLAEVKVVERYVDDSHATAIVIVFAVVAVVAIALKGLEEGITGGN